MCVANYYIMQIRVLENVTEGKDRRVRAQTFEVLTGGDFAVDYAGSADESADEEGAGKGLHLVPIPESMVEALRVKLNVWSS